MIGRQVNNLRVVRTAGVYQDQKFFFCRCVCGNTITLPESILREGKRQSCSPGECAHPMERAARRELRAWKRMISNCHDRKSPSYHLYGKAGIRVHPPWRKSFQQFLADVGPCPGLRYSLDRDLPTLDFGPTTTRWAPTRRLIRNRSNTVFVTYEGARHSLHDLAETLGFNYQVMANRLRRGMLVEEAITKPIRKLLTRADDTRPTPPPQMSIRELAELVGATTWREVIK